MRLTMPRARGGMKMPAMRPSERMLLLVAVSLIVVVAFIGFTYQQASAREKVLNKQLASTTANLENLKKSLDVAGLEKKLAEMKQQPTPWQRSFLALDIDNLVTGAASQAQVELTTLKIETKVETDKIGMGSYAVEKRQVIAQGELSRLVNFIGSLERGTIANLRLDDLKLTLTPQGWTANFNVKVWYLQE